MDHEGKYWGMLVLQYWYMRKWWRRLKYLRMMHVVMVGVCMLGSIYLGLAQSYIHKLIVSVFLIAYTMLLISKPRLIKLIFSFFYRATVKQNKYTKVNNWKESQAVDHCPIPTQINRKGYSLQQINIVQQYMNDSNEQSKSSFSFLFGHSMSKSKDNIQPNQWQASNGFELDNICEWGQTKLSKNMSGSSLSLQKTMILVDKQTIASRAKEVINEYNKQYQNMLNKKFKITVKQAEAKYKNIICYTESILVPLVNEYTLIDQKTHSICQQYLDPKFQNNTNHQSSNFQFKKIIQICCLVIPIAKLGLVLKRGKKQEDFLSKCMEIMQMVTRLAENVGVNTSLLQSRLTIEQFMANYTQCRQKLLKVKEYSLVKREQQDHQYDDCREVSHSKIWLLNVVIIQLNKYLKNGYKIKMPQYWSYKSQSYSHSMIQIYAKDSFDAYFPHLDVSNHVVGNAIQYYNCRLEQTIIYQSSTQQCYC